MIEREDGSFGDIKPVDEVVDEIKEEGTEDVKAAHIRDSVEELEAVKAKLKAHGAQPGQGQEGNDDYLSWFDTLKMAQRGLRDLAAVLEEDEMVSPSISRPLREDGSQQLYARADQMRCFLEGVDNK